MAEDLRSRYDMPYSQRNDFLPASQQVPGILQTFGYFSIFCFRRSRLLAGDNCHSLK